MPVARYFLFVGGVLLALLFALDLYVPREPVPVSSVAAAAVQNPTLRIRSDHKWPERVVYDTSLPTIVPPVVQTAEAAAVIPAPVSEISAKARARESFAQLSPPEPTKPEPQLQPKPKRKIARNKTPPMRLVAQHPGFGFFGNNTW